MNHKDGERIRDKYYREHYYYPALEALEIRRLTPHCCRHTFATLMAKAGVDTISIQKLIGHSKYSFTADTYTHTDIEELKKAIDKI
ncbi:MAG: tyrosine-type recombinase/integrase [Dehalobacterium sp.]